MKPKTNRATFSPDALKRLVVGEYERRGFHITAIVVRIDGSIVVDFESDDLSTVEITTEITDWAAS